jgi:hypothetical protein
MFILNRMPAKVEQDGQFSVAKNQVRIGARARLDGKSTSGAEFFNEAPLSGRVNFQARTFEMDGTGQNAEGRGVVFHLVGDIANRPPTADPGPDRVVECESPTTTTVSLDGGASLDGDPGDAITHYQWFRGPVGVSNQSAVTLNLPLGDSRFRLHVYDKDLASDSREQSIQVVDTTPPELVLARDEWCLWPPNHAFALFKLGQEIAYSSTDRCDSDAPTVKLVEVTSCVLGQLGTCDPVGEAVDARGSGSTSPDIRFGASTACVRAERTGTGSGRYYLATIEATDAHGNSVRKKVRIIVPHDSRGHASCVRAEGVDEMDHRCDL